MKAHCVLVIIVLALLGSAAQAETYIVTLSETEAFQMGGQTQPAQVDTMAMWIGKDKAVMMVGDATKVILDVNAGKYIFVKPQEKSYAEFPADILGTMVDSLAASDRAMADSIRGMIAQMMGEITYSVQPTDSTKKIGEWNTRRFDITMTMPMGGKITADSWVTKDVEVNWDMYRAITLQTLAFMPNAEQIYEETRKLDGMTVETNMTTEMMGMSVKSHQRLIEFDADRPAPEGIYDVPADYTKSDNPMMFMGQ